MSTQHDSRSLNWHYTELDDKDLEIRGKTLFSVILLFSIIILITVLFLYTRWVCRYNHHRNSSTNALHAPPSSLSSSQGLDPASIKKLPIILHQAPSEPHGGAWEETECCICLGEFIDGEKLKGFTQT
ncbi:hypothetical protein PIB30_003758 [Stylosanthes scabra]|uniref:RING-H2 finger protein ATL66 n=1 Tax=Stylosanthes scabra TaxID=79078 RepID=A0ABU6R4K8_9FABA|nr:hypothetical protein [Stylosanthes scabra]